MTTILPPRADLKALKELPEAYKFHDVRMPASAIEEYDGGNFPKILPVAIGVYALVQSAEFDTIEPNGKRRIVGTVLTREELEADDSPRISVDLEPLKERRSFLAGILGKNITTRRANVYVMPSINENARDTQSYYTRLQEKPELFR